MDNTGYVVYCEQCANIQENDMFYFFFPYKGYIPARNKVLDCSKHHGNLIKTNMTVEDYDVLCEISKDPAFFEAMMRLKEEDIIEYQSRMAQFRAQVGEQESAKAAESAALKCPRCGSTNISTGARGVSFFWGFLGADKTVNRCAKCGHTWKPRG